MSSSKNNTDFEAGALSVANLAYLEGVQRSYGQSPEKYSPQWKSFFAWLSQPLATHASTGGADAPPNKQLAVSRLIDAYRQLGCRVASIDPLEIEERPSHPSLEMENYGLTMDDFEHEYSSDIPSLPKGTLHQFVEYLQDTYCCNISAEFMHITDPDEKRWFIENYEATRGNPGCSREHKLLLLERLVAADMLEKYINTRFTGQKRFSLEGGDALVSLMDEITREAARAGCKETCVGMAHRGRLNLLINLMGKQPNLLFEEFEGKQPGEVTYGSGDVKYHMGYSSNLNLDGKVMHLALGFNPSHLEIVNPVIEGSVWARQARRGDKLGTTVLPILIHGDAALSGQGIGMETLNMSQTRGYCTGGTIHVVVNNQVGFTTSDIRDARSTYWCTDLAKMAECPVLHANGNDPEAVSLAARLALAYRWQFHKDVFIDLVCYRRHGHNEQDEPKVTQPYMYTKVMKLPSPATVYAKKLVAEGVVTDDTEGKMRDDYVKILEKGEPANPLVEATNKSDFVDWSKYAVGKKKWDDKCRTAISKPAFEKLGTHLATVPDGFKLHPRVQKIVDNRAAMVSGQQPVDWGMAENLAYASLLDEGYPVRLSGQDVGRGTFFHRHAVWHDQARSHRKGPPCVRLAELRKGQPKFVAVDSLLSEAAVLGFEYGVSLTSPDMLVVWEAQFGDFANSAQVVIDQFISSGEFKWGRLCGLVMLLPHGYEGQGPEHSSARLERYMQLCAEYNMQVCVPSTAAQIFHLLRRQMIRPLRRPLVVMTPKSLLRNKQVASPVMDFTKGEFKALIPEADPAIDPKKVNRLVVCSGKVYYELLAERVERKLDNVAIVRLEQLYPFPHGLYEEVLRSYKSATTVLWCQEEPGNQGAWHRIQHYLRRHLREGQELRYSLRASSASTATGKPGVHKKEQGEIIEVALMGVDRS